MQTLPDWTAGTGDRPREPRQAPPVDAGGQSAERRALEEALAEAKRERIRAVSGDPDAFDAADAKVRELRARLGPPAAGLHIVTEGDDGQPTTVDERGRVTTPDQAARSILRRHGLIPHRRRARQPRRWSLRTRARRRGAGRPRARRSRASRTSGTDPGGGDDHLEGPERGHARAQWAWRAEAARGALRHPRGRRGPS